jgi:serpin B
MRQWRIVLIAFFCIFPSIFPGGAAMGQPTTESSGNVAMEQAKACNQFATELYAKLAGGDGNLVFSPVGLHMALGMAEIGAKGETAEEMAAVLHVPVGGIADVGVPDKHVSIANAMWVKEGVNLLPSYIEVVSKRFSSLVQAIDFNDTAGASQTINAWIADHTGGKITDLIAPDALSGAVKLVLTNAIYLKADWVAPFDKSATHPDDFHAPKGVVTVQMMRQTHGFPVMSGDGFGAIELPYLDSNLSMVMLLPDKEDGLGALEAKLNPAFLDSMISQLKVSSVDLSLPKFKLTKDVDVNGALGELGMHRAFAPGVADFSGIDGTRELFISQVVHKAYVAVDEKGTEAAAATAIIMRATAIFQPNVTFRVDHPFIWLLRDRKSGEIEFLGRVTDPAATM